MAFQGRGLRALILGLALVLAPACATVQEGARGTETLQTQIQALEARVRAVESRREQVPAVVARARAAVAFIWGAYTFVDEAERPLRHVLNEAGEPIADVQGVPRVDLTGTGPVAVLRYSGTAFLVDKQGHLLTNRHIAEPWWDDESAAPLLAAGLQPRFLQLRAFFQDRADPVPIEVLRVDPELDVALVRTIGWTPTTEPLAIHPRPDRITEGQPVMLVGFPTGLDAVLSKLTTQEYAALERAGTDTYGMVEHLARDQRLLPTITGGFVWEVKPHILVYDARTAGGGSGGPVLDRQGQVIGVNAAYDPEFEGGNYGVPIRVGEALLTGGGLKVNGATRETPELLAEPGLPEKAPIGASSGERSLQRTRR